MVSQEKIAEVAKSVLPPPPSESKGPSPEEQARAAKEKAERKLAKMKERHAEAVKRLALLKSKKERIEAKIAITEAIVKEGPPKE